MTLFHTSLLYLTHLCEGVEVFVFLLFHPISNDLFQHSAVYTFTLSIFVHVSKPPTNILYLWHACAVTSDRLYPGTVNLSKLAKVDFCWLPPKETSLLSLLH